MKEYRQNSHTVSLVFWSILCTATAIVLFVHSHKVVSRALKTEEILAGVALLIFGPAALTAYLLRGRHVWVNVDQIRGIVVSGRRVIPWEDIRKIERRRPSLRKSSGPAEISSFDPDRLGGTVASGCAEGCFWGLGELFVGVILVIAVLAAFWVVFFVFVPLIVLPVLEVFAPFGDRFKIVTSRGTLVLRDLRDADEFVRQIEQRRPVTER